MHTSTGNYEEILQIVKEHQSFINKHEILRGLNASLVVKMRAEKDIFNRQPQTSQTPAVFEKQPASSVVREQFIRLTSEIVHLQDKESREKIKKSLEKVPQP